MPTLVTSKKPSKNQSGRNHSAGGEVLRMSVAAAVGAAAAYGFPALWKLIPAQIINAVTGQVTKVADTVKGTAVEGATRVAGQARKTASQAKATSSSTAKRAASGSNSAARRTTSAARRTTKSGPAAKRTSAAKSGSAAKGRTRKSA